MRFDAVYIPYAAVLPFPLSQPSPSMSAPFFTPHHGQGTTPMMSMSEHSPFGGHSPLTPDLDSFDESGSMEFSMMSDYGQPDTSGFAGYTMDNMNFSDPHTTPLLFRSPTVDMGPSLPYGQGYPSLVDPLSTQTPLRQPQIHIDTTGYGSQSSLASVDGLISPYDTLGPISRRPSLTTPSTSTSSHLTTPEHSPGDVIRSQEYLKPNASPISPSTSLTTMFEQQAISLQTDYRPRSAIRTVTELAREHIPPFDGTLVPQKTYRPHTQSDRRRYVDDVELEQPIMFYLQNPQRCGITLQDALNGKFMDLMGRDDHMFINRGPSVSIRLMWPGYAPWSRQIPTRDFRSPPQPITKAKLAKNVAKTVQRFIHDMEQRPMEEDANPVWRVGAGHIQLQDLTLVGLQHVSMGSWQAYVVLRPGRH